MPEISRFFGMIVTMYYNDRKRKGYKPLNLFMENRKNVFRDAERVRPWRLAERNTTSLLQAPKLIYGDY